MNEANAYTIRPATAADSTMIKRTVRQARLDRTGLDWRNFKIAEQPDSGDMIGFCRQPLIVQKLQIRHLT